MRRGSGGSATAPPPAAIRPGTTVMIHPDDPYAHTKKSRTKPIRNADGVLIRKDGRPDMRSQSSAANLRKVHARKEEERMKETGDGPHGLASSGLAHSVSAEDDRGRDSASASPDTPDEAEAQIQGDRSEEHNRHEMVMKSMFPKGVEERRGIYGFPSSDDDRDGESERDTVHVKSLGPRQDSSGTDAALMEEGSSAASNAEKTAAPTTAERSSDAAMKDAEGVEGVKEAGPVKGDV